MTEKFEKSFRYFNKMSPIKKVLVIFIFLLIFILIVEQPGSDDSKRQKGAKFLAPKLNTQEVSKIRIYNPNTEEIILERQNQNEWRVSNGRFFPANSNQINDFLKMVHDFKQDEIISKNPDRLSVFGLDDNHAFQIQIWNHKNRLVADFYAGKTSGSNHQYFKKANEDYVIQSSQKLNFFLLKGKEGWQDKTLLSIGDKDIRRISLKSPDHEIVLEKINDIWRLTQPEDFVADELSIRTLLDQLNPVQADSFADSVNASQADFDDPDYKISIRFSDDSLKLVLFESSDKENQFFAKNAEVNMVYYISSLLIDNIFGLEFKVEEPVE